jgi:hypothetical protein
MSYRRCCRFLFGVLDGRDMDTCNCIRIRKDVDDVGAPLEQTCVQMDA